MLSKVQFNRLLSRFQNFFDEKYDEARKEILYSEVVWLNPSEFQTVLNNLIKDHNKKNLPSIKEVGHVVAQVLPELYNAPGVDYTLKVV